MKKNNKKDKSKKKKKYNSNNLNDFTQKNFFTYLFSGWYIFDYKFIMYWLPLFLYVVLIYIYIFITHTFSNFAISLVSSGIIFITYFLLDLLYQNILCNKASLVKKISNSFFNSITPCIFVFFGYMLGTLYESKVMCNYNNNISNNIDNSDTSFIYNTHSKNILTASIFYILSIIYSNPINKKKCISNKLC